MQLAAFARRAADGCNLGVTDEPHHGTTLLIAVPSVYDLFSSRRRDGRERNEPVSVVAAADRRRHTPDMIECRLASALDSAYTELRFGNVDAALSSLIRQLRPIRGASRKRWRASLVDIVRSHVVASELVQSPLAGARRAATLGAATHDLMLGIYDGHANGRGATIYHFERRLPSIAAMRSACEHVRSQLMSLAERHPSALILAAGCRHLREVDTTVLGKFSHEARFLASDDDADTVASIRRRFRDPRVSVLHASRCVTEAAVPAAFDYVYSVVPRTGKDAFLTPECVRAAFETLRPGGTLLLASFAPARPDAAYLEAFLDLWPAECDEARWTRLTDGLTSCAGRQFYRDPSESLVFARLVRG